MSFVFVSRSNSTLMRRGFDLYYFESERMRRELFGFELFQRRDVP